ncbi:MAG TPA: DNA polymerase/3'-5' exonuclease PolX [Candidatus Polarisedimenticolaceae bacterium]|nr:DNA polymerase/3'-5' exonuclease PolX [Candidatus Polarisedimenticolaceae bacterium]
MQDRFYIAGQLRQMGRLLSVMGENPFKIRAYERAARALENVADDFDARIKERRLTEIDGIGKALAAVVEEIYHTGESVLLQQLSDQLPPGAVDLNEVPGLTLKKIVALHERLGIKSVDDLKTACEKELVRAVKGFGQKAEANILAAIEKLQHREDRTLISHALADAQPLLRYLRGISAVADCEIAGSLRRCKETVRQICIVAASADRKNVLERFLRYPLFVQSDEVGTGRCTGHLSRGLDVELQIVPPEEYATALHYWTGSKDHYTALVDRARSKGIVMSVEGLRGPKGKALKVETENDIYRRLGLEYIAPELRENQGEIEAAANGSLPKTVVVDDIQGMVHCHTTYSDGQNTIEEMARAAEALGMQYITFTDHSPTASYAGGVKIDRLRAQWEEIDRVQERVRIKLLKGTESDILEDGLLDYPDYILEKFDVIIASIHTRHKMNIDQMTARLLRALKLPLFKIWGHPLGRLIESRPPFECRMDEVLDAVAASPAAIEVNGDPRRLDLEPRWIRAARQRGIKFVVSTDAHSIKNLQNLAYGVAMACRGWLSRDDILNTLPVEQFTEAVRP